MKCFSNKTTERPQPGGNAKREPDSVRCMLRAAGAFTLVEVMTALAVLALVSSSVLVVMDRCMVSVADSASRMRAFTVARENMEQLLTSESVEEMTEYGTSEEYPEIEWQTTVETFNEPVTGQMWVRAICSAEYTDTEDNVQTVELTQWLTVLTEQQANQLAQQKRIEQEWLDGQGVTRKDEQALRDQARETAAQEGPQRKMPTTKEEFDQYLRDIMKLFEQ